MTKQKNFFHNFFDALVASRTREAQRYIEMYSRNEDVRGTHANKR